MQDLVTYYENYVNSSGITTEFDIAAEHCLPTLNYGEQCSVKKSPYIGKCNYDGAGRIFDRCSCKDLYEMLTSFLTYGCR